MHYNYHTHTYRCNHASGTEREYIETAIKNGIKKLGFSDHIPQKFENGYESFYRVPVSLVGDYFETLKALRDEYKDRIDIIIGFEMEYYPKHFEKMYKNALEWGAEYLILGQHYLGNELPERIASTIPTSSEKDLENYTKTVLEGMKTGVFTYLAHPDLLNFTGDAKIFDKYMRKICVLSRELNLPVEINCLGLKEGRAYPREDFWEIAGEEQSPVVLGVDAHDSFATYDVKTMNKVNNLVNKYKLNLIDEPKIVYINKKGDITFATTR